MNSADKKRLLYLCSMCPNDNLVYFDEDIAFVNSNSQTMLTRLSEKIHQDKIGVSPTTLQSIITMLPKDDIVVSHPGEAKLKFKSGDMQRTIAITDASWVYRVDFDDDHDKIVIINPQEFAKAITFVSAFAKRDPLSLFSSVFVKISENTADIYATDGTSMAHRKYVQKIPFDESVNLVLSHQHLQSIVRVLTDENAKLCKICIDKNKRLMFSSGTSEMIAATPNDEFRDFISMINHNAALTSDRETKPDTQSIEIDNAELKQALTNIVSMFVKDEFPFVDLHITKDQISLDSEVITRGYDCFRAVIPAKSTANYSVRVSPILFLKALSKIKNATIYWRSGAALEANPFVIDNTIERVFFAPLSTAPKDDASYE